MKPPAPRFLIPLVALLVVAPCLGAGLTNGELSANSHSLIGGQTTDHLQVLDLEVNSPGPDDPPTTSIPVAHADVRGSMDALTLSTSASMQSTFIHFFSTGTSLVDFVDDLTVNAEGIDAGTDLIVEVTWNVSGNVDFNSSSAITTRAKILLQAVEGQSWTQDTSNHLPTVFDPTGEVTFSYEVKAGQPAAGNIFLRAVAGVACGGPGSNYFGTYFSTATANLGVDFVGATKVTTAAGVELYRWDTSSASGLSYGFRDEDPPLLPEINVQGNGQDISSGDSTPEPADHTDFGSVDLNGPGFSRTFTIANTGLAPLNISSVDLVGGDSAQFLIATQAPDTIADGSQATFEVSYLPDNTGTHTTTIRINNDDADESPYEFTIQGLAVRLAPDIEVQGAGITIDPGDFDPSPDDDTDYGEVDINGAGLTHTFTIKNNGEAELTLLPVEFFNGDPAQFTIATQPSPTVATGSETSFEVRYNPDVVGSHFTSVFIESNDPDVPFYEFDIQGSGISLGPEIAVSGAGMTILEGDPTPSPDDGTDFGSASANSGGLQRTFTITNNGPADLEITAILFNGEHRSDFSLTLPAPSPIASGSSSDFEVTFRPSAAGLRSATLRLESNSPQAPVFEFAIQGTGSSFELSRVERDGADALIFFETSSDPATSFVYLLQESSSLRPDAWVNNFNHSLSTTGGAGEQSFRIVNAFLAPAKYWRVVEIPN